MSQATATVDLDSPIDLARAPDFGLGTADVHPSISEVSVGAHRIRLQPRMMQVLVALARAEGEVEELHIGASEPTFGTARMPCPNVAFSSPLAHGKLLNQ